MDGTSSEARPACHCGPCLRSQAKESNTEQGAPKDQLRNVEQGAQKDPRNPDQKDQRNPDQGAPSWQFQSRRDYLLKRRLDLPKKTAMATLQRTFPASFGDRSLEWSEPSRRSYGRYVPAVNSRPPLRKGGAGPRLRLNETTCAAQHGPESAGDSEHGIDELARLCEGTEDHTVERVLAASALAFAQIAAKLAERADLSDQRSHSGPRRLLGQNRINVVEGAVRHHLDLLLAISCDDDILQSPAAEEDYDAVADYEDSGEGPPGLHPLRPSWTKLRGPWNITLAVQFQKYMINTVGLPAYLAEDIREAFLDRLKVLRRVLEAREG